MRVRDKAGAEPAAADAPFFIAARCGYKTGLRGLFLFLDTLHRDMAGRRADGVLQGSD